MFRLSAPRLHGSGIVANRFLQRSFLGCALCGHTQRLIRGYRPIPNPITFNVADHSYSYHKEMDSYVGSRESRQTVKCDGCGKLHGQWSAVDFQTHIRQCEKKARARSPSAAAATP